MAYNPADYEARRRGYTQQYGTTGAMNAYANFLSQQRFNRDRQNLNEQYDKAATTDCGWLFSSWDGWS
jgi:hypothetical protein